MSCVDDANPLTDIAPALPLRLAMARGKQHGRQSSKELRRQYIQSTAVLHLFRCSTTTRGRLGKKQTQCRIQNKIELHTRQGVLVSTPLTGYFNHAARPKNDIVRADHPTHLATRKINTAGLSTDRHTQNTPNKHHAKTKLVFNRTTSSHTDARKQGSCSKPNPHVTQPTPLDCRAVQERPIAY